MYRWKNVEIFNAINNLNLDSLHLCTQSETTQLQVNPIEKPDGILFWTDPAKILNYNSEPTEDPNAFYMNTSNWFLLLLGLFCTCMLQPSCRLRSVIPCPVVPHCYCRNHSSHHASLNITKATGWCALLYNQPGC